SIIGGEAGRNGCVGVVLGSGGLRFACDSDCPQYAQNAGGSPDTFISRWQCGQVICMATRPEARTAGVELLHYRRRVRKHNHAPAARNEIPSPNRRHGIMFYASLRANTTGDENQKTVV